MAEIEIGQIVGVTGPVVEVLINSDKFPGIYDILYTKINEEKLAMEVLANIGDNKVKAIALGSSIGLKFGLIVTTEFEKLKVPVGVLGRMLDSFGNPIDDIYDVEDDKDGKRNRKLKKLEVNLFDEIIKDPPKLNELASKTEFMHTGIKVLDFFCPIAKGSKIGIFGGAGVGKTSF